MKNIKAEKIIYIVVGIVVLAFFIFKFCLELWGSYTIGYVDGIATAKGGTRVGYHFYYNGKKYKGGANTIINKNREGKPHFIKFWKLFPQVNLIQVDKEADACEEKYKGKIFDSIPDCR